MNHIDLVYLWVDGSDPEWLKKKNQAALSAGLSEKSDNNCAGRFHDNDELMFSLRSVEKFAPWIHHIYIVTDHQCPEWLNLNHPKIRLVDLADLLPESARPCFNSSAIETFLAELKDLSEFFLYANDDMLLGSPVTPEDFFTPSGRIICRMEKTRSAVNNYQHQEAIPSPNASNYSYTLKQMRKLVYRDFGVKCNFNPHHNIDSYRKSLIQECNKHFHDVIANTRIHHFRHHSDIQRALFHYYGYATGQCEVRYVKINLLQRKSKFYLRRFLNHTIGVYPAESLLCNLDATALPFETIAKLKPKFFCLNDRRQTTNQDRRQAHDFLQSFLPEKSQFEK